MKTVGIREVQVNLTKLLYDLPFEITRYGRVVAVVRGPKEIREPDEKTMVKNMRKTVDRLDKSIASPSGKWKFRGLCKHGASKGLCKHGCK